MVCESVCVCLFVDVGMCVKKHSLCGGRVQVNVT